ncbi:uncharacterized protein A4U43_C10F1940 [Asparagus officinalis]|uniref:Uncharacterized protein n=1 Tax=Asparagus officinalis TaxID=4686 RepID=A0A5P1E1Q3_ASPOF|nr:uncharacterized protein A4U43_C10F1940 [Asparagus officinalis]
MLTTSHSRSRTPYETRASTAVSVPPSPGRPPATRTPQAHRAAALVVAILRRDFLQRRLDHHRRDRVPLLTLFLRPVVILVDVGHRGLPDHLDPHHHPHPPRPHSLRRLANVRRNRLLPARMELGRELRDVGEQAAGGGDAVDTFLAGDDLAVEVGGAEGVRQITREKWVMSRVSSSSGGVEVARRERERWWWKR